MNNKVTYNENNLTKVWVYDGDKTTKKFKSLDLLLEDHIKLIEVNKKRVLKGRLETTIKLIKLIK